MRQVNEKIAMPRFALALAIVLAFTTEATAQQPGQCIQDPVPGRMLDCRDEFIASCEPARDGLKTQLYVVCLMNLAESWALWEQFNGGVRTLVGDINRSLGDATAETEGNEPARPDPEAPYLDRCGDLQRTATPDPETDVVALLQDYALCSLTVTAERVEARLSGTKE